MTRVRTRGLAFGVAAVMTISACAQLESRSTFAVEPSGAAPIVIGKNPGKIIESALDVQWSQAGNSLELELIETRLCRQVLHEPVVRVEKVDNKVAGGALYWEYGIAAAALTVGLIGLIRPELYSPDTIKDNGTVGKATATGYRVGGIFTALGAGVLAIAVYDTVRSRDKEYRTDAYQVALGDQVECATPELPLSGANVEVAMGDWTADGVSTKSGSVVFRLPAEASPAPAEVAPPPTEAASDNTSPKPAAEPIAAEAEKGAATAATAPDDVTEASEAATPAEAPPPVPQTRVAKVSIAGHRAIEIEILVPYDAAEATSRSGAARATRTSAQQRAGSTSGS